MSPHLSAPISKETAAVGEFAYCSGCGAYHPVTNRERLCCHCLFRRRQARKSAGSWYIPWGRG